VRRSSCDRLDVVGACEAEGEVVSGSSSRMSKSRSESESSGVVEVVVFDL